MEVTQDNKKTTHAELGTLEKSAVGVITAVILGMLFWIASSLSNVLIRVSVIETQVTSLSTDRSDYKQELRDLNQRVAKLEKESSYE